jgi:hypothetical protein
MIMAQLATTFSSYDVKGMREDLSDLISNIAPTETPFQTNIGSEPCGNTYFEWQTDTLAAASGSNAQIEGDDLGNTYTAVVATTRLGNYTQILRKDFLLSRTEQVVRKAGRSDERGYQAAKAAKELKRDWETSLLDNNAAVAGNDTTARETGGLPAWIKTNISSSNTNSVDPVWSTAPTGARSDGTQRAFTETILKAVVKLCWDNGADPSMLMVGSFNKQAVSAFAGIAANRNMVTNTRPTIVGGADAYMSDFGELVVVPNRFQRGRDAFVMDPTKARIRVLDGYTMSEMAKTGDGDKYMFTYEAGLQIDNEKAFGICADLTTS